MKRIAVVLCVIFVSVLFVNNAKALDISASGDISEPTFMDAGDILDGSFDIYPDFPDNRQYIKPCEVTKATVTFHFTDDGDPKPIGTSVTNYQGSDYTYQVRDQYDTYRDQLETVQVELAEQAVTKSSGETFHPMGSKHPKGTIVDTGLHFDFVMGGVYQRWHYSHVYQYHYGHTGPIEIVFDLSNIAIEDLLEDGILPFTLTAAEGDMTYDYSRIDLAFTPNSGNCDPDHGTTVFVDVSNNTGVEDGTVFHPYNTIKEGIVAATDGDTVLVADGIYTGAENKNMSFGRKAITVASLRGPDNCIIDCEADGRVFVLEYESSESILEGFTIRNASNSALACKGLSPLIRHNIIVGNGATRGAAIWAYSANLRIEDNIFRDNVGYEGGAIYMDRSTGTIIGNRFEGNGAGIPNPQGNHAGGAIYCTYLSSPLIMHNDFINNSTAFGGAIATRLTSSPRLVGNRFDGNRASYSGGALFLVKGTPVLQNNIIVNNYAAEKAGGLFLHTVKVSMYNNTIANNSSPLAGGILAFREASADVVNSILWNNSGGEIVCDLGGTANVSYSDVMGGFVGICNMNIDPKFANEGAGDYRLAYDSPCISVGTANGAPEEDIDGNPRPDPIGTTPDIGACENRNGVAAPPNMSPFADAGSDQMAHLGTVVTLYGKDSYDQDGHYPLSYNWQIISAPEGTAPYLIDPTMANPVLTIDEFAVGDYEITLIVTDALGKESIPDNVRISTFNAPPVAEAGEDLSIIRIGTTVRLDGTQSYDDEGDPLTYQWAIRTKPVGSLAVLSDPTAPIPSFQADVHGDYIVELIVSDPWTSGTPDTVTISFSNVTPIADAGDNQSSVQGDMIKLNGSGSSDGNLDPLSYSWSIVSKPEDSLAEVANPTSVQTSFFTDLAGAYVISLVVNDGFIDSVPSNITVVAVSFQDATVATLQETIESTNDPDAVSDDAWKNKNMRNSLTNKINSALSLINNGYYEEALDKLQNDILGKTDGCAETGAPDKNDWIRDCDSQNHVYPLVIEAINHLQSLI